jgi:SEL1 protein
LGRIYYFGSVYPQSGGLVSGAEAVGAVPQSYTIAHAYFLKAARAMWPSDPELTGGALPVGFDAKVGQRQMSGEAYDALAQPAATAAGMLGRMYLRGEGGPQNLLLAHLWLKRASGIVSCFFLWAQDEPANVTDDWRNGCYREIGKRGTCWGLRIVMV